MYVYIEYVHDVWTMVVDEHEYDKNWLNSLLHWDIWTYFDVETVRNDGWYRVERLICLLKLEFVNSMNYVHLNDPNSK